MRSRAASASSSAPGSSRKRPVAVLAPGVFMRALLSRPSRSCTGTIAVRAREASASRATSQLGSSSSMPASRAASSARSRAASVVSSHQRARGVVVVRAGVGDAVLGHLDRVAPGREQELQHRPCRQPEPVAQLVDGLRDHAEVLGDERQLAELGRRRCRRARARARGASCPRAPSPRRAAPPRTRRSRGSGRCAPRRRARRCGGSARSTSGSRSRASRASRRAGCSRAGPCRSTRPAARPRPRRRGRAPGRRGGRRCRARRRSARRRAARPFLLRAYARSAVHSRSKRTWSASAPSPANAAQLAGPEGVPRDEVLGLGLGHLGVGIGEQAGPAGEGGGGAVRRAVLVRRAERQDLPPRLPGRVQPVDEAVRLVAEASAGQRGRVQQDAAGAIGEWQGRILSRRGTSPARCPPSKQQKPRRRASASRT